MPGAGPAGAVAAAFIGVATGYRNLIGIDVGGTSADIGLIHDGAPGLTDKGHIGHDSSLEEAGCEPLVPRHAVKVSRVAHVASA